MCVTWQAVTFRIVFFPKQKFWLQFGIPGVIGTSLIAKLLVPTSIISRTQIIPFAPAAASPALQPKPDIKMCSGTHRAAHIGFVRQMFGGICWNRTPLLACLVCSSAESQALNTFFIRTCLNLDTGLPAVHRKTWPSATHFVMMCLRFTVIFLSRGFVLLLCLSSLPLCVSYDIKFNPFGFGWNLWRAFVANFLTFHSLKDYLINQKHEQRDRKLESQSTVVRIRLYIMFPVPMQHQNMLW